MPGLVTDPSKLPETQSLQHFSETSQELDAVDAAHVYAVIRATADKFARLGNVKADPKALAAALADAAGQEVAARLHENVVLGQKYEKLVQSQAVLRRQPNKLKLELNQVELNKVAKQLREGTWQLYQYLQDRPDPMDIVALAGVEQVTLRSRFQACLAELQASGYRNAPPTLMSLMRSPFLAASLSSLPDPHPSSPLLPAPTSPPLVPRLRLDDAAPPPQAPAAGAETDKAAAPPQISDAQSPSLQQEGNGAGGQRQAGAKAGGSGEAGQVELMVEREREANAAIKQLKTEWRDERAQHEQQMAEASKALAGLAVEYRRRQARLASDADYCERQARAAEEAASQEEALRLAHLHTRAAGLKKQIDQERRVHEAATAFLKQQTNDLTEQGLQWASRLETDLAEKERELDTIRHNHQQAQLLLKEAEDRQGGEMVLKEHRDAASKLQAEQDQQTQAKQARQANAAVRIQAAWRGHLVRAKLRNTKPTKAKKKK